MKLNFDQNPDTLRQSLKLQGKKPKLKKRPLLSSQDLFAGSMTWLFRQPPYVQKMVNHLGVYSYQPKDIEQLKIMITKYWNQPFSNLIGSELEQESKEKKTEGTDWNCKKCDLQNKATQEYCQLCDQQRSTEKKTFDYDVFGTPAEKKKVPVKETKMTLEEEAQAVFKMRNAQEPFSGTNKPYSNHIFNIFSEAEQEQVLKMLSELEAEEKVKKIGACKDLPEVVPRFLFALFKKKDTQSSQLLIIDKVNHSIEWFDPTITQLSVPQFSNDDPRANVIAKKMQDKIKTTPRDFPDEIKSVLSVVKEMEPKFSWKTYVNKETNKQLKTDEQSDFFSLWYLMMRFGYERQGGPQSPEQLDQTTLPFQAASKLFVEFFQE